MITCHLQKLLKERKISQTQLYRETGVRLVTINEMCLNKCKHIPVENLNAICSYLGCNVSDILEHIADK